MPRGLKNFLRRAGEIFAVLEFLGLVVRFVMLIVTFVFNLIP
jgi:hypothetical protein